MHADKNTMVFNKHIIAALIITPILAIIAWIAIDHSFREEPHAAVQGAYYELLEMPNCRYESGHCSIKNGDVKIDLEVHAEQEGNMLLSLHSELPLDVVRVALSDSAHPEEQPTAMTETNAQRTHWQTNLPASALEDSRLRIAIAVNESFYFAEVSTRFIEYRTLFNKDFRRQSTNHP
jgi:hypothetical protein